MAAQGTSDTLGGAATEEADGQAEVEATHGTYAYSEQEYARAEAAAAAAAGSTDEASALKRSQSMLVTDAAFAHATDWIEYVNEHGETYYCNPNTGETSWEPPQFQHNDEGSTDWGAHADANEATHAGTPAAETAATAATTANDQDGGRGSHPKLPLVKRVLDGSVRRLDVHVQRTLEEALRRHHELESLRDEEVRLGGEHWVEMYDPTHDCFYYYGLFSGEMSWERPESYVMKAQRDDVLGMVVKLQCAFRISLARRRVFQMKVEAMARDHQMAPDAELHPWIEVYDPFHKVLYYYNTKTRETRWDAPEFVISAGEDREMAAAIAIQSMTRSHMARKEVKKRRETLRKRQQDQAVEEKKRLREMRRREYFAKTDDERAAICRREMVAEEMEQIRHGDFFWGIDKRDKEVLRQRIEEKLLADAELFWQRVNFTLRLRGELETQRIREEEDRRKETELINEAMERDQMTSEEDQQRQFNDNFWGIQAQERREDEDRVLMAQEELLSERYGQFLLVEELHAQWHVEAEARAEAAKRHARVHEKLNQKAYFKWFYHHCTSSDQVLEYMWPTQQRFVPPVSPKKSKKAHDTAAPKDEYLLDDIVLRLRMEDEFKHGRKSIYTIHQPNDARIQGRRGHYDIDRINTEDVFVTALAAATTSKVASGQRSPLKPAVPVVVMAEPQDDSMDAMGVHFGRAKTPDPHLPARYNGVPFKPSELSPTRDILFASHMKQNQLPSLHIGPHAAARAKKLIKPKRGKNSISLFSNQTMDPAMSSMAFASPFALEERERRIAWEMEQQRLRHLHEQQQLLKHQQQQQQQPQQGPVPPMSANGMESIEKKKRLDQYTTRFAREERDVLHELFVLMDTDQSNTINKKEMMWALQRDTEVQALAKRSALLALLLKQHSHLEELFKHLRMRKGPKEEISWELFVCFCEQMYIRLMDQGLLHRPEGAENATAVSASKPAVRAAERDTRDALSLFGSPQEEEEEHIIRNVFAILDFDGNGFLEVKEIQDALYSSEKNDALQALVANSKSLRPLLHEETLMKAFSKMETDDPRGISCEEFVVFCLEIASIAELNNLH
ncbi:TPA: hypothetical protein N0F65_006087 [Lagenidium giganteum]|uniref:Calmodulin n=1 Tax=Lagenidium giganteum TaxID=4803 RepID=A0AAV2YQ66_9STRA|nr:TPA: hypothetical protein N0F65_006087 [Lagenidium giganteum]